MARKTETSEAFKRGDDETDVAFRVSQEGFTTGRAIFVRLAKAVGPALGVLAEGGRSVRLAPAIKAALENLNEADLEFMTEKLGASSQFSTDGARWPELTKANREELFGGSLKLYFEWLYFALRVNFSDFLPALPAQRASDQEGGTPESSKGSPSL